jgi:hypothetical protein
MLRAVSSGSSLEEGVEYAESVAKERCKRLTGK